MITDSASGMEVVINTLTEDHLRDLKQRVDSRLKAIQEQKQDDSWKPYIGKCFKYESEDGAEYYYITGAKGSMATAIALLDSIKGVNFLSNIDLLNTACMKEIPLDQFVGAFKTAQQRVGGILADVMSYAKHFEESLLASEQGAKTSDE